MNLVHFNELVSDVAEEMGWDATMLSPEEWTSIRRALNLALHDFWQAYWWPETMVARVAYYAEVFDVTKSYAAGTICYDSVANAYFQAVQAVPPAPPDIRPPNEPALWAPRKFDETAPPLYDPARAYVQGERVQFGGFWFYCHTDAVAGIPPTESGSWGQLAPFDSVIPYVAPGREVVGRARNVVGQDGCQYDITPHSDGVHVQDGGRVPTPTLLYQVRVPQMVGDHWSATAAYTQERPERAIYGLGS